MTPQEKQEVKHLSDEEAPGGKSGKAGGHATASKTPSAAAIAKVLAGTDFPKRKDELKEYAQQRVVESEFDDPKAIGNMMNMLPDKEYHDMSDVEKSLFAEAGCERRGTPCISAYACNICTRAPLRMCAYQFTFFS